MNRRKKTHKRGTLYTGRKSKVLISQMAYAKAYSNLLQKVPSLMLIVLDSEFTIKTV